MDGAVEMKIQQRSALWCDENAERAEATIVALTL